jgi:hypothetical protein
MNMGSMDQFSINSVVFSDFELISKVLENSKSLTAREISSAVTEYGIKWDKGQSNSALYKMLAKGLVEKDTSQGTRPYWRLSTKNTTSIIVPVEKLKVLNKHPSRDEFIPLKAISEYTITLGENLIEFAVNPESSPNDPYISCDWLDQKIFVAINARHPYILRGVSNELILAEFLLFLALDAICEWRIIRDQHLMKVHSFIEIKDKILRNLN